MIEIKVSRPHEPCPACDVLTSDDDALACCVGCRRTFHAACFFEKGCALCAVAPAKPEAQPEVERAASEPTPAAQKPTGSPPPEHKIPAGETLRWLDRRSNLRKLAYGFAAVCLLIALPELLALAGIYHKHPSTGIEVDAKFGFYPVYGFVAYSLVVILGLGLQRIVQRREGYYDDE